MISLIFYISTKIFYIILLFHSRGKRTIKVLNMEEEISPQLRQKIDNGVEKVFALFIDKASKGGSLEELLKNLITERVYGKLGPRMNRYAVKKIAKKVIRKTVDRVWERHKDKLILKLQALN